MPLHFQALYHALSDTTNVHEKIALLARYLEEVPDEEFGWAVYLLQGGALRGAVSTTELRQWVAECADLPTWLVEESYGVVGDLAETLALIIAGQRTKGGIADTEVGTLLGWIATITELAKRDREERKRCVLDMWRRLRAQDLIVFNKLLTGGLRIGVSKGMVARALSELAQLPYESVLQRLAGGWTPESLTRAYLTAPFDPSKSTTPYPFFLAYPLSERVEETDPLEKWQVEWKWDGIRAQIVKRGGVVALWSRGDELLSEGFPELIKAAELLPDGCVIDGEVVAWAGAHPGSFFDLQKRINRKKVTQAIIKQVPVHFLAYDLLEHDGSDIRSTPLADRRMLLRQGYEETLKNTACMELSPVIEAASWSEVVALKDRARENHAEGLMLKRRDSIYGAGRTLRGAWWKWKVEPYSVDAVLLYAQKGHGRRADLFTDYTFGVWDGDTLVTFAKAYSGLTESEIKQIDAFVKKNTQERFGPVRTVAPQLVFEIAFEAIQASSRHRSGVAVRFPRIIRWRRDKPAAEADTLDTLKELVRS
jgi:DNA ligase-1